MVHFGFWISFLTNRQIIYRTKREFMGKYLWTYHGTRRCRCLHDAHSALVRVLCVLRLVAFWESYMLAMQTTTRVTHDIVHNVHARDGRKRIAKTNLQITPALIEPLWFCLYQFECWFQAWFVLDRIDKITNSRLNPLFHVCFILIWMICS